MGSSKTNRSLYLPARTLKVYTEALTEFSKVVSPEGLNIALLFQCCVLENDPTVGPMGRTHLRERGKDFPTARFSSKVNSESVIVGGDH